MTMKSSLKLSSMISSERKNKRLLRIINQGNKGGILNPDTILDSDGQTVFDVLKEKHPSGKMPGHELLKLPSYMKEMPKLGSVEIIAEHVENLARKLHGSGGPGGSTSEQWTDFY